MAITGCKESAIANAIERRRVNIRFGMMGELKKTQGEILANRENPLGTDIY